MSISQHPTAHRAWDGTERRHRVDDDYTGTEHRRYASHSPQIMDARLKTLEAQHADIAVLMGEAVATAMRKVLTDPEVLSAVWSAAMNQAQKGAAERTGRWLWGSLRAVASRWVVIAAVVLMVGKAAGLGAAVQVFDWMKGKP